MIKDLKRCLTWSSQWHADSFASPAPHWQHGGDDCVPLAVYVQECAPCIVIEALVLQMSLIKRHKRLARESHSLIWKMENEQFTKTGSGQTGMKTEFEFQRV
jgi:NADH:ubiquinone oxidoreductase subunit B-like Fe-S oxidoreductase